MSKSRRGHIQRNPRSSRPLIWGATYCLIKLTDTTARAAFNEECGLRPMHNQFLSAARIGRCIHIDDASTEFAALFVKLRDVREISQGHKNTHWCSEAFRAIMSVAVHDWQNFRCSSLNMPNK
ncbi:hypothetical protein CDAR_172671 [Caerostris darwini]|uniref:Uncharacterized protein n=1 Tax=Caerostris darwini TaxID=1538125 RepID=A0AAV4MG34_9ARAC|nr:hypothetical protein CDAR_172671 [Caerostris darwini]